MSAIHSYAIAYYTAMANTSALNMMRLGDARTGLISSPIIMSNPAFGSLDSLAYMDTQMEIDLLTNSLQYKMAKAMLEQLKKQQKEDAERFNVFA